MAVFSTLVIDAPTLFKSLSSGGESITLLDVRPEEHYASSHMANAHPLSPALNNRAAPPQVGLLPAEDTVQSWAAELGLSQDSTIVVYDNGKDTSAARALWVMHAYGFTNVHWLNGGLPAWVAEGHSVTDAVPEKPAPNNDLNLTVNSSVVLSIEELKAQNRKPIDARSAGEFAGTDVRSERGGHMPGAVHYEWVDLFTAAGTLKPEAELRSTIDKLGLAAQDSCVVYCQSHQRSSVTYVVLKHLGFKDVAALDGAWSAWGNDANTPVEL